MYGIRRPTEPLRPFIECYWFLDTDDTTPVPLEEIVFTDGRADLMLCFGSPYLRQSTSPRHEARLMAVSHLDAQRRYPVHIVQQGHSALIGVRFRPGGLAAFLPMPMSEIEGLTLDLPGIFGSTGLELEQRLFAAAGDRFLQATLLDGFFLSQVTVRPAHAVVAHMIATIDRHHGQMRVRDLSRTSGYSVRMVDRLFAEVLGLPPKFYSRVVRLRQVLHGLVQHPAMPWADLAACSGYYDQPHFVKEFEALTGLRPEEYRPWVERYRRAPAPNHVQFVQDTLESEPIG